MLYFRGCTAREKMPQIEKATEYILNLAGIKYEKIENEGCCGSVLLRTGFKNQAKEQMEENMEKLEKYKDEIILTSCSGCYKTLKDDYKEILGENLKIIHISQLLNQLIKEGKIKLEKENITVTYHDPCHLGRHSGEFTAPREVIKEISNLEEMEHNKMNALCCGSGGGVKSAYDEISNTIAKIRIGEAKETNAEFIVTACPFCKLNLETNGDMKVLDLSEFTYNNLKGGNN